MGVGFFEALPFFPACLSLSPARNRKKGEGWAGVLFFVALAGCSPAPQPIRIGAASTLRDVLTPVEQEFGGNAVTITFAASGTLTRQMENGSPYDILILADKTMGEGLHKKGLEGVPRPWISTPLALWSISGITKLVDLKGPEVKKIAIANPETAPVGKLAVAALKDAGVWDSIQPKIVYGANAEAVAAYAKSGNVGAALVSLSLAVSATNGQSVPIPKSPPMKFWVQTNPNARENTGLIVGNLYSEKVIHSAIDMGYSRMTP